MSELPAVTIYTSGTATPGGGAYGALLLYEGHCREISGGEQRASNNRMDLLGAVEALRALKRPCRVTLYNGNGYLIDAMARGWAARWRDAGWQTAEHKPTAHSDLWDGLLELCAVHEVAFVWLPSPGIPEYARCRQLAQDVIREQVRQAVESRNHALPAPGSSPV